MVSSCSLVQHSTNQPAAYQVSRKTVIKNVLCCELFVHNAKYSLHAYRHAPHGRHVRELGDAIDYSRNLPDLLDAERRQVTDAPQQLQEVVEALPINNTTFTQADRFG